VAVAAFRTGLATKPRTGVRSSTSHSGRPPTQARGGCSPSTLAEPQGNHGSRSRMASTESGTPCARDSPESGLGKRFPEIVFENRCS
jgi:hypothetical protein